MKMAFCHCVHMSRAFINLVMYINVCMYLHHLGSKVFSQQLKDMKVPIKYHDFQCLLSRKVTLINKHQEDGPLILTWQQILRYV